MGGTRQTGGGTPALLMPPGHSGVEGEVDAKSNFVILSGGKELACEFPPRVERSAAGRHHCGGIAWHEQSLVDPGREQVPRLALAAQARLKTALVMTVDTQILPLAMTDFVVRESLQTQSNSVNYESACTWDICSLSVVNEMVSWSVSRRSRGPWEEKITSTKSTSASCA
jgi:hypothetical protein